MKNLKDEIEDKAYREILELKDVDEMFDLLIASAYFRGRFDGMLSVDESRLVFKKIKSLLVEQEKERAIRKRSIKIPASMYVDDKAKEI